MEKKIVLEIEELEERIAPHCALGFGSAQVEWAIGHPPNTAGLGSILGVPGQGNSGIEGVVDLPESSTNGLAQFDQLPGRGCGSPVPPGHQ